MQIKVCVSMYEAKCDVAEALSRKLDISPECIQVEIQSDFAQLNSGHKIPLIKFMRQVILDFKNGQIPLNEEGTNVGLATAKDYVEKYLGLF